LVFSSILGASKEIGTALTRVCLRHKAVETRMKTFTTAIMDSLIIPLQVRNGHPNKRGNFSHLNQFSLIQDKLEEWKRQVVILDKDHTKEYKRARNELKKRSSDTLRLQKKAKKGTSDNLQSIVDASMQTVNQQKAELDEVERKSLRNAMIEDRTRYCHFVNMLQPVVKQEYEMMYELGHLQVSQSL
jgi:metastasis suppressor protein 1